MENLSLLLFMSIAVPVGMMLFICRREMRHLIIFFLTGMVVALFSGELNGILIRLLPFDFLYYTTNTAPVVEEVGKAIPIIFYALVFKPKKQTLLEISVAVGIGFAVLESAFVFASSDSGIQLETALLRAFGAGMMHGICSLAIGFGMSFVTKERKVFFAGTLALLSIAIVFHSAYNNLIVAEHTGIAFLLPSLTLGTAFLICKIKKKQKEEEPIV